MNFLDKLPKLPILTPKKPDQENFFALTIDLDKVTAAVWTVLDDQLHVINVATANYSNADDFQSDESVNSLIEAANYSLDEALADIAPEPNKLLFGVPDFWLIEENIKPEYLKVLKRMVRDLGVEPMAYVSTTHAIAHVLQKQYGVPLSAILINIADPLVITVTKGGKTMASQNQRRGKVLGHDVEKALSQMPEIEVLPSKILLYGDFNESIRDELAAYPWMNQLPFLHLPRLEVLNPDISVQATCFAGGSELNPNLASEIVVSYGVSVPQGVSRQMPKDLEPSGADEGPDEEDEEAAGVEGAINEAGFVEGDINQRNQSDQKIGESEQPEKAGMSDNSDFSDNSDNSDNSDSSDTSDFSDQDPESEDFLEQEEWVEPPRQLSRRQRNYPALDNGEDEESMFSGLAGYVPAPLARFVSGNNKWVLFPLLLLVILILFLIFVPKAAVSVFVDMKPLDNSTQIIADPKITAIDESANRIPGKIIETDISGSGDGLPSGTKQVGDPAKGKVIIYNATGSSVSLSQGAVLATGDGKKFTLNTSVSVASKSASAADPPSHSNPVDATASQIGPDGNIAAGTDLSVSNFDKADVVAKVDAAFAGGLSKNVQVVTAADQQKLLTQVTSDLKTKAQSQLQSKLTGDLKILQESFSEIINKKTYSKNVGDEADKFNLTVSAHYKGTAYSDSDLKSLVQKLVQTKVPDPEHYTLDLSQTETQAEVASVGKDGTLSFSAKFKAKLMPKLDVEKLRSAIAGKPVSQAEQILKDSEQQIIGASIKLSPSLPGPFQRLPLRKENITIEVTAK